MLPHVSLSARLNVTVLASGCIDLLLGILFLAVFFGTPEAAFPAGLQDCGPRVIRGELLAERRCELEIGERPEIGDPPGPDRPRRRHAPAAGRP